MHAKNRLSNSAHSSPSPPSSPRRNSPRYGVRRSKSRIQQQAPQLAPRTFFQKLIWLVLSVLFRRQGFLLFAPLLYVSGMLLYMGSTSFESGGGIIRHRPPPGSVYRSPQVFEKLWPHMISDNSSYPGLMAAWQHPKNGEKWIPCITSTINEKEPMETNGYILIDANGGLNQQRVSICNAVAVAGLLNATLVLPRLRFHSIWQDPSKFGDIYDVDHFINILRNDVKVVTTVPEDIMEKFDNNISNIFNFKIKAWSSVDYYEEKVLPKLTEDKVIRISPFANRLSYEVPHHIQRLRCLANYEALKFAEPLSTLAQTLIERMSKHSAATGGKYIAVHLRFEEDMVAFSCCIYDGGQEEKKEMDAARERGWRGKFSRVGRIIRPGVNRMSGKCPLTPLEVGMMLRGMGYDNNTSIYLAAGKIYKAEKNMLPLQKMFPLLQTKETLASSEELASFKDFSSRMAALDYTVCLYSEVFVTTQGGNFPHFLIGHRRYLYGGHSRTIKPDKRKLALVLDNLHIGWEAFKKQMQAMRNHSDIKGIEMRKVNASVYTYPLPDCMCRQKNSKMLHT